MIEFSTKDVQLEDRAALWNKAIADAYFPLQLNFRDSLSFEGNLSGIGLGKVDISRLNSRPAKYERLRSHIKGADDEEYLVTIPLNTPVEFRQLGKDITCDPGGLILQRGDEPYRFMYEDSNDLFVLKVAKSKLAERVSLPDRYCGRVVDTTKGCANLFTTLVKQAYLQGQQTKPGAQAVVGKQLIELLSLALDEHPDLEIANSTSVRAAHIVRINHFIQENLKNTDLSPDMISAACGISKRYLHALFRDENTSVSQRIRDQRLLAARDQLMVFEGNVAEIAYRHGFNDQSQFSRLFKAKFSVSPSEYRRRYQK